MATEKETKTLVKVWLPADLNSDLELVIDTIRQIKTHQPGFPYHSKETLIKMMAQELLPELQKRFKTQLRAYESLAPKNEK